MPVDSQELMTLLCQLSEEQKLKVAVKESLKGGIIAGTGAVVGGLAFGPVGIAIGSTIGGCVAAVAAKGKFKSVAEIIASMPEEEQDRLADSVRRIMQELDATDVVKLAALMAGDMTIKRMILQAVISHFQQQMCLEIID